MSLLLAPHFAASTGAVIGNITGGASGTRSASWGLGADGFTFHRNGFTATTDPGLPWITPQVGMDQYEVRATLISGNTPSGILGTWLSLDVNRQWTESNINYDRECDLLIEIRRKSDGVIVASGTVNISSSGTA